MNEGTNLATATDTCERSAFVEWRMLATAFHNMFWPLLLVAADFSIRLGVVKVDVLPDALGWFWLFGALGPIQKLAPLLPLLRKLAIVMTIGSLPSLVLFDFEPIQSGVHWTFHNRMPVDLWTWGQLQISQMNSLMFALFIWCLGGFMIKVAMSTNYRSLAKVVIFRRWLFVVPVLLLPWAIGLSPFASGASLMATMLLGMTYCIAVIMFLPLPAALAVYCESEALSNDSGVPDLSGEESSPLENRLRPSENPRSPFRFSLFTALLIMAVVGMASFQVHLIWLSQESAQELLTAKEEIRFYREQLDDLRILEPDQFYVRRVPRMEDWITEWRIYVPEGGPYELCACFRDIPDEGIPEEDPDIQIQLQKGESVVTFEVDPESGSHGSVRVSVLWDDPSRPRHLRSVNGGPLVEVSDEMPRVVRRTLQADEAAFYQQDRSQGPHDVADNGNSPAKLDGPVVFWRVRNYDVISNNAGGTMSRLPEGDSRGLILWIHPSEF